MALDLYKQLQSVVVFAMLCIEKVAVRPHSTSRSMIRSGTAHFGSPQFTSTDTTSVGLSLPHIRLSIEANASLTQSNAGR